MKVNNLTLLVNYGKNFSCQEKCSYCNWRTGTRFKEIDFTDPDYINKVKSVLQTLNGLKTTEDNICVTICGGGEPLFKFGDDNLSHFYNIIDLIKETLKDKNPRIRLVTKNIELFMKEKVYEKIDFLSLSLGDNFIYIKENFEDINLKLKENNVGVEFSIVLPMGDNNSLNNFIKTIKTTVISFLLRKFKSSKFILRENTNNPFEINWNFILDNISFELEERKRIKFRDKKFCSDYVNAIIANKVEDGREFITLIYEFLQELKKYKDIKIIGSYARLLLVPKTAVSYEPKDIDIILDRTQFYEIQKLLETFSYYMTSNIRNKYYVFKNKNGAIQLNLIVTQKSNSISFIQSSQLSVGYLYYEPYLNKFFSADNRFDLNIIELSIKKNTCFELSPEDRLSFVFGDRQQRLNIEEEYNKKMLQNRWEIFPYITKESK